MKFTLEKFSSGFELTLMSTAMLVSFNDVHFTYLPGLK